MKGFSSKENIDNQNNYTNNWKGLIINKIKKAQGSDVIQTDSKQIIKRAKKTISTKELIHKKKMFEKYLYSLGKKYCGSSDSNNKY